MIALVGGSFCLGLGSTGRIISLHDMTTGREYLPPRMSPVVLTLYMGDKPLLPTAATLDATRRTLTLAYEGGSAQVQVSEKSTHITLRLERLDGLSPTRIEWGPFPTTINKTVGETVAVVRDDNYAIGLQSLSLQNSAGASGADFGSRLHASAAAHEGGVLGSAIALFGCPAADALKTIGEIEVAEGLPHPLLDGVWAKLSPAATDPHLITEFSEADLDDHLDLAQKLGIRYVYAMNAFRTWGHFLLNPDRFPEGDESLKRCCQRAAARGIGLGLHTLTAFITTNDPYVTPKPDPRLARLGSSALAAAVDEEAAEIPVADRAPFVATQIWGWSEKYAVIGEEIIRYAAVTDEEPYTLTGCTRGMFGTSPSAHEAGADIGRLATHYYRTFYPGIENGMADEMALRLAKLFSYCGVAQTSFDGLEGLMDYGWPGEYTRNRFVSLVVNNWPQHRLSDASNLLHYTWHIHPRMCWGEPWGKAMREGQLEGRLNNQAYFDRNLLPHMLGWFEFRAAGPELEATSLDEMEWMLAKCAAFDAGFALVTSPAIFRANGYGEAAAVAIREWEKARRAGAFAPDQRQRMKVPLSDWHLEPDGDGGWRLWPLEFSPAFTWSPDQPQATWQWVNHFHPQPLQFVLRALPSEDRQASLANPTFTIAQQRISFPVELKPRQYLVCEGDGKARLCDPNWNVLEVVEPSGRALTLPRGDVAVSFTCQGSGALPAGAQVKLKVIGPAERVPQR